MKVVNRCYGGFGLSTEAKECPWGPAYTEETPRTRYLMLNHRPHWRPHPDGKDMEWGNEADEG